MSSSEWAVLTVTAAILIASLALHYNLRPYADHELDHSDEDSHDRSVWTEADKVDGIGMACEILPLLFAVYFISLGDNPEQGFVYYAVSVVSLIVSMVPIGEHKQAAVVAGDG